MGCGGSKLDDLEAVTLCRNRSRFLEDAISYRYAMADAHAVYSRSLRSVGVSLHRFLEEIQKNNIPVRSSPRLALPPQRKGDKSAEVAAHSDSQFQSDSHIHFHSDEDDSDEEHDFPLHSDASSSPIHFHHHDDDDDDDDDSSPAGPTVHYAKSQPPNPSVTYEQRPPMVYYEEPQASSSSSSSYPYYGYPHSNSNSNPNPNPNPNFYSNPFGYQNSYGEMGGYFGASPPRGNVAPAPEAPKPAPAPPSPPRVSTWDFLNPFENYESYYGVYTPSRSSKDVREEEGIPDLEDEESEVVKEVYGKGKGKGKGMSPESSNGDRVSEVREESEEKKRKSVDVGTSGENVDTVVEKNVVVDEVKQPKVQLQQNVATLPLKRYNDVSEVALEIRSQFDRASDSAVEVSKMLEVGKQPYHQKNTVYKVSSRMICGVTSFSSMKEEFLVFEDEKAMGSGNLSSTLQKLYIWENKLYDEVKAEEKMRVYHDRKSREMKRLDERGAEAHKLDSTLAAVRKLSTKIRIAIQVVDTISKTIGKLRDDELWPQINELIQGFIKMWSVMLECHRIQCQALSEAKNLESLSAGGKISDAHMEVTKQLELELLQWVTSYSAWMHAQKGYVKALNGWLLCGFDYEPEETADGVVPFSPGRLGAPPVFVICNQWAQTMDRISEKEVIDAMNAFAANVLHLWKQHNSEQRQRLMANKEMENKLRIMEREEHEMLKVVEAQNKKLVQTGVSLSEHTEESNLQDSLKLIFEAMENFSANTLKAYEELQMRAEEERQIRENE